MSKQYVEQREDVYWVSGTRVSLDSLVYAFLEGQTAESIAQSFPVLTLEQVYGAITFYLANRPEIDAYLQHEEAEFEALRQAWRTQDAMFYQKMADARRHRHLSELRGMGKEIWKGIDAREYVNRLRSEWNERP
jgi:uncharacterized protein (DUF433 family)